MSGAIPAVLTLEQAAERLQVPAKSLEDELAGGRLRGFRVAGLWRITESALLEFMGESTLLADSRRRALPILPGGGPPISRADVSGILSMQLEWQREPKFTYKWPKRREEAEQVEAYSEAYRTRVRLGKREVSLLIGFTTRPCAGKSDRGRAVVFLADRHPVPVVEFAGADDYARSGIMASVIRLPRQQSGGHPHLHLGMEIPPEYQVDGITLCTYDDVVTGPNAVHSLAVQARRDELNVMCYHALVRVMWKGWL